MWASSVEAAVAPQFTDLPPSITVDQEIEILSSLAGDKKYYANKTYYLRGVFYKTGTSYFGLVQNNNGDWIGNESDRTKFYEIQTDSEGSWSGKLRVKADSENSNFKGNGGYYFKVGRYTSASDSSADWSGEQAVEIGGVSPTPTESPTSTPTPTSTSAPTTLTPPTPKATAGTAPKPTATVASVLAAKTEVEPDSEVTVAAEVQATATPSATPQPEVKKQGKWPWLMMVGGGGLAVMALFPFLRKWYHDPSWLKTLLKGGDRSSFGQE